MNTDTTTRRVYVGPSGQVYSCLTVKRLPIESAHLMCADCEYPIDVLSKAEQTALNGIGTGPDGFIYWDEYIAETVHYECCGSFARGRELCEIVERHKCQWAA